ncbi:hypothetical protein WJX72_000056 [[Myrmecia] bisecta]|uniref:Uncharacterized protein n=1 Tax=[Myrmecia] bisecta TaxID=41462 RepID=A0AAW1R398_9CHLO
MYFAYGWPKALAAIEPGGQEDVVYLHLDDEYCVIVSTICIQVWTGGQHRIRLGAHSRDEGSVRLEGLNRRAFWCNSRRLLAVLTYNNVLHIYGLHESKESVLQTQTFMSGSRTQLDFKRLNLFLQYSLAVGHDTSTANDIVGDSRSVLVGLSDGTFQLFSWQGKLRGRVSPFTAPEGPALSRGSSLSRNSSSIPLRRQSQGSGGLGPGMRPPSPSARMSHSGSNERLNRSTSGGPSFAMELPASVETLDYSSTLRLLVVVLADGRCAVCRASETGLAPVDSLEFSHWLCAAGSGATVARIAPTAQLVALGLVSGEVALYRLWGAKGGDPLRVMSLADWGYGSESTGSVADLQWSPDNCALAVGWRRSGLGVWSTSGCRLVSSLRQTARASSFSPSTPAGSSGVPSTPFNSHKAPQSLPLESGVAAMAWGVQGYRLMVAESGSSAQLLELALAKSVVGSHRLMHHSEAASPQADLRQHHQEVHILQADDRLLLIMDGSEAGSSTGPSPSQFRSSTDGEASRGGADLVVHHLRVPHQYIAANYPIMHASLSSDGLDIAVAGTHGLALYSRRSGRWRLFGDVSQEREMSVQALLWLPRIVVASVQRSGSGSRTGQLQAPAELLLYPRYHLDNSSLLARYPLPQVPLAMDCIGNHLVVASAPLEVCVLRVDIQGSLVPLATPNATLTIIRELSIMSVGQPLKEIALVEPQSIQGRAATSAEAAPRHCVLLRAGGIMSVLDMEQGSESDTEADDGGGAGAHGSSGAAWHGNVNGNTPGTSSGPTEVEIPWWTYGARGMQLWFPSSLAGPLSAETRDSMTMRGTDPELEFDREVYPIGISLAEVAIVGVTQRMTRSNAAPLATASRHVVHAHSAYPCFHPMPESQPVLPCLLRRLLQQDKAEAALALAHRHCRAPHFSRSLEWLLFTSLEFDADGPAQPGEAGARRGSPTRKRAGTAGPLLLAAANLIRQFPQFRDVVVSVARKTDAQMWPSLFAAVGAPSALLEGLLDTGALQSAACCLLIVDRIEGAQAAHKLSLRLIQEALEGGQYELAAELLRFVIPPGENDSILSVLPQHASANGNGVAAVSQPVEGAPQQQPGPSWLAALFGARPAQQAPPNGRQAGDASVNGRRSATGSRQSVDGSSKGSAAGEAAWGVIGAFAWRLLDMGALRSLAHLGHALGAVGGALPALLAAPSVMHQHLRHQRIPTALSMLSALAVADAELPVCSDKDTATDAQLLLESCRAANELDWIAALALVLENTHVLLGVRREHPQLWYQFSRELLADKRFTSFWEAADADMHIETGNRNVLSNRAVNNSVHAVILAGGPSDNPLARFRAMPAVEIGSNAQLIDVPISNCIRSGINKMYVLTQFNSHTLNTHITSCYPPAVFGGPAQQGWVDVLACHQTPDYSLWYRGSADAVRRNLSAILEPYRGAGLPDEVLILSGQALYRMDYRNLLETHWKTNADITLATHSVGWGQARLRGLARVDPDTGLVTDFAEKPSGDKLDSMAHASKHATPEDPFEASMGIYIFKREVLEKLLQTNETHFGSDAGPDTHFGHDVIPHALRDNLRIVAHHFDGYWRDVQSLRDFYEVNLELAGPGAPISIYDVDEAVLSRGVILPPALMHQCEIENCLIGEGSVLRGSTLKNCVVGCNSFVGNGCHIENTLLMGNDAYTNDHSREVSSQKGEAVLGIGAGTTIKRAIIDDNAAVGPNCTLVNSAGIKESDRTSEGYVIQDGILVVLKGAVIPADTVI